MTLSDMLAMITVLALWDNAIKPLCDLASLKIMIWIKRGDNS